MNTSKIAVMVACIALAVGCGGAPVETEPPVEVAEVEEAPAAEPAVEARNDMMYVCACGPDCTCNAAAAEPGDCTCGTEMTPAHLVKVEGNEGLLCTCELGCTCELDAEDESKCSCGSDIRRVSFEGTGLHYCNCGGSCTCNFVSAEPGTCQCGMELITS